MPRVSNRQSQFEYSPARVRDARDRSRPLLVASDASAASDDALRAAQAIALHTGRPVRILAVHEPTPIVVPEIVVASSLQAQSDQRAALEAAVRAQLARLRVEQQWELEIAVGDPASTIVKAAKANDASLVIMGLGEHGVVDRVLGDETVLRVLRFGTVPVLAVAPGFTWLPMKVVAAVDFSASSARAVAMAAELMNPMGSLVVTHVVPRDVAPAGWNSPVAGFEGEIGRAFDQLFHEVEMTEPRSVQRKVVVGDPSRALLDVSSKLEPDLLAVGSHGHGFLTRLLLGSVSQRVLRTARCSVLVAPPEEGRSYLDEVPQNAAAARLVAYEWVERLEEFTRRNGSRHATLEVIDPDLGAQIEEKGLPFIGASFDPRDGRVHVMLGDAGAEDGGRHLTRSIAGATAVQVLRDREGRDLLLRVAHGDGQTLLTLER